MSRTALALLLFAACQSACQSAAPPPDRAGSTQDTDDEDAPPVPVRRDPATLPGPGRRLPPTLVHWEQLEPVWSSSLKSLRGPPTDLASFQGKAVLFVNTASKCGQTKQYAALEALQQKYEARGFTVVGFPSNQFNDQEPGTDEEIAAFCSATYGVTFPMTEKIEVNGAGRHEIYKALAAIADPFGYRGDIRWNFEKFVVSADGSEVTRFGPRIQPDDPAVIAAVEAALPRS